MKILYILTSSRGGINTCVNSLVSELKEKHQICVLAGLEDNAAPRYALRRAVENAVSRTYINLKGSFDSHAVGNYLDHRVDETLRDIFKSVSPDIIHIHSLHGLGVSAVDVAKQMYIPVVITMHDWWAVCPQHFFVTDRMSPCGNIGLRDFSCLPCGLTEGFMHKRREAVYGALRRADALTAPSKYLLSSISAMLDTERPVELIENGVNPSVEGNPRYRAMPNKVRFGYLGGNNVYKGIGLLLQAFSRSGKKAELVIAGIDYIDNPAARQRSVLRKIVYIISRAFSNPMFFAKLKNLLKMHILRIMNRNIEILPHLTRKFMDDFYAGIDILVIPSITKESFSYLARESLTHLTPVIASRSGGPEEVIKDGVNGLLFDINDAKSLEDKMREIINDPASILRLRGNIRCADFTGTGEQAEKTMRLYESLIKNG